MASRIRRASRFYFFALASCLAAVPATGQDDAVARFVSRYQNAYAQGRDLVPDSLQRIDTASIANELRLETVKPVSPLTGNAFLDSNGTIVKLAGVQGCLSTEQLTFLGKSASCAMISLAGLNAGLDDAKAAAGDAFPCHFLAQISGNPSVRIAECFFTQGGAVHSISESMIRKGVAFAARDRSGNPVFPEYALAEIEASKAKAGIWANAYFSHPYGDRFRNSSSMN